MTKKCYFPARSLMFSLRLTVLVSLALTPLAAQDGQKSQPALIDRQKETALALSACPPAVAEKAAVYVLEESGYVKVRDSKNDFTAIVQHSQPNAQEPQCMDAEGARTFLPRILKVAELRAQGKSAAEIRSVVTDAIAKGVFPAPGHPGVIYMLSTQNLVPNSKGTIGAFPPHVMFYGTRLTNADLGVDGAKLGPDGNPKGPTFVAGDGSPFALVIVPVAAHTMEKAK